MPQRPETKPRTVRQAERRAGRDAGRRGQRSRYGVSGGQNRRIPPFVWLLVAVGCLVAIPVLTEQGYRAVQIQHLVDHKAMCPEGHAAGESGEPCLVAVTGELRGPYYTRREPLNSDWKLFVQGARYDEFALADSAEADVRPLSARATALTRDGDVVAIQLPDGRLQPVWGLGWRGATQMLLIAVACVGGVIGAMSFGQRRRRAVGSWWRVHGEYVNPGSPWATMFLLPASLGLLPMLFGIPWWPVWLLGLVVGSVVAPFVYPPALPSWFPHRPRRAGTGRHASRP